MQDDWRARKNLTRQRRRFARSCRRTSTTAGTWRRAAAFTWSPFKNGKTTIRARRRSLLRLARRGHLRADPARRRHTPAGSRDRQSGLSRSVCRRRGAGVLPPSKYMLADGLVHAEAGAGPLGRHASSSRRPSASTSATATRTAGTGSADATSTRRCRWRSRPDPALGNITQVESTATLRVRLGQRRAQLQPAETPDVPLRQLRVGPSSRTTRDGAFSLPADSYDLAAEWGPRGRRAAAYRQRRDEHAVSRRTVRFAASATARSGTPYNITTGRDDNGDTVFNDRPGRRRPQQR